jgi:LacI family transcriptional regulator
LIIQAPDLGGDTDTPDETAPAAPRGPATIYDVAAAAGVSIKTVSRVLNREPNVRHVTRERVVDVASRLRYRPNASARSLAGSRSYLIGLLIDNPSLGYVAELQFGAMARCRQEGFHLVAEPIETGAPDTAARLRAMLVDLHLDGVILTPPACDDLEVLSVLEAAGAPFVRIAPGREPGRAACVRMDDAAAAHELTGLLLQLGHRDIGFILGDPAHGAAAARCAGFKAAMAEAGVEVRPDRLRQGDFSYRSGVLAAEALLAGPDRPTAIFAGNDDMALGAISTANRLGLSVPGDVSVCGFDDTPAARAVWPRLTTVRQPIVEMAQEAAGLLIAGSMIDDRGRPVERLLAFRIEARESTAPPPRT